MGIHLGFYGRKIVLKKVLPQEKIRFIKRLFSGCDDVYSQIDNRGFSWWDCPLFRNSGVLPFIEPRIKFDRQLKKYVISFSCIDGDINNLYLVLSWLNPFMEPTNQPIGYFDLRNIEDLCIGRERRQLVTLADIANHQNN